MEYDHIDPDLIGVTDRAGCIVELPETTAYGYGIVLTCLLDFKEEAPGHMKDDVEELVALFESAATPQTREAVPDIMTSTLFSDEVPVEPQEVK